MEQNSKFTVYILNVYSFKKFHLFFPPLHKIMVNISSLFEKETKNLTRQSHNLYSQTTTNYLKVM